MKAALAGHIETDTQKNKHEHAGAVAATICSSPGFIFFN